MIFYHITYLNPGKGANERPTQHFRLGQNNEMIRIGDSCEFITER